MKSTYIFEHWRDDKLIHSKNGANSIVNEGKNKLLDVLFVSETQFTTWPACSMPDNHGSV